MNFKLVGRVATATVVALTSPPLVADVALGPITNPANGHDYYLLSQSCWTEAESEAVSLGGHLVTINDQAENDFVYNTFAHLHPGDDLWIGFNDATNEGVFEWVSGETSTFTNWACCIGGGPEPNNLFGDDYAVIWRFGGGLGGEWADLLNCATAVPNSTPYGVVEVEQAAEGTVTFFTSIGPDPAGDEAWRATANRIVEFDFEEFANATPIDLLQADGLEVDVDLCGLNGPAPAGQAMTAGAFAYPGAVFGTALLNRPPGGAPSDDRSDIVFRFGTPVTGAGAWMFDDQFALLNQKRMVALDTAGRLHVSPIIDNPGTGHMVEGFIGVTAGPGVELAAIAIQSLDGDGASITGGFEVDHVQVALRTCAADLDGNGDVGFEDLSALLSKWGWCETCPADMNGSGDGWVGFDDLVMLLNAWGPC